MKLGKYILGLALIAAGLTSCDQENVGAIYEPQVANVSFMSAQQSTLTKANNITVPVAVSRATTKGTASYAVTISDADPGVTLKDNNVTFADGEGMAYVNVDFANMGPGQTYSCVLNLSSEAVATANPDFGAQVKSTSVSVMCDFDWEELGNGFYSSPEWWEEEFYVPITHAKGSNIYSMIGLFQDGYDIQFTIENDNKVYVDPQPSWYHSSYGDIYLVGDANDTADGYAGTYDPASKKVTFILYHYVPGVGGFGTFVDTLTMP
jgi:hypothetical protein